MKLDLITLIAEILVVVGAINWGLVGIADLNLVARILGTVPLLETITYALVGLSGIWMTYVLWIKK